MANKVKTFNINLNKSVKKAVHHPRTKSGYVLYTHTKDFKDDGTSEDSFDRNALKDSEYIASMNSKYNSPKNIKRLFITVDKVYVQYYTSFFVKNARTSGTWISREFSINNKSIRQICEEVVQFSMNSHKIDLFKQASIDVEETNYVFKEGSVLKALSNGWILSNVEEFYVDWSAFLNDSDRINLLPGNPVPLPNLIHHMTTNLSSNINHNYKPLYDLVNQYNCGSAKSLETRFPRLRAFGVIQGLSTIMTKVNTTNSNIEKDELKELGYDKFRRTWYENNKNLIESEGGMVLTYSFPESYLKLEKYKTAVNQYRFDYEVLDKFFNTYTENIKKARIKLSMYGEDNEADSGNIGDVESVLVAIQGELTNKQFKVLLQLASKQMGVKELREIFSEFSKSKRDSYSALIGLNLSNGGK